MGKHSVKKESRRAAERRGFDIPVGPASEPREAEADVPEEIEKTAAGKMQTGATGRVEGQTSDEKAEEPLLDEWMQQDDRERAAEADEPAVAAVAETASIVRKGRFAIAGIAVLAMVIIAAIMIVHFRPAATPTQVVDSMLHCVQARDFDALAPSYQGDADKLKARFNEAPYSGLDFKNYSEVAGLLNDQQKSVLRQFKKKLVDFNYSITAESVGDDTAKVTVKFQTADLGKYYQDVMGDYLEEDVENDFSGKNVSDRDMATSFVKQMDAHMDETEDKSREATTDFELVKVDGNWRVAEVSDDNFDAMTGGLGSISEEMQKLYDSLD